MRDFAFDNAYVNVLLVDVNGIYLESGIATNEGAKRWSEISAK